MACVVATASQAGPELFVPRVKNTFIDIQLVEEPDCPEACLSSVKRRWNHRRIQSSPAASVFAELYGTPSSEASTRDDPLVPVAELSPRKETQCVSPTNKKEQEVACRRLCWSSESEHEPEHEPMPMSVHAPEQEVKDREYVGGEFPKSSRRRGRGQRGGAALVKKAEISNRTWASRTEGHGRPQLQQERCEKVPAADYATANGRRHHDKAKKVFCHIHVDPKMLHPDDFCLIPKIIGKGGCNTRAIWEATGIKVRLRGRGSGHIEPGSKREADCHLMVALAGERHIAENLGRAVEMAESVLKEVADRYVKYCKKWSLPVPNGPSDLYWIGESSELSLLPAQRQR